MSGPIQVDEVDEMYEMAISALATWQAQSMSNSGSSGNRTLPRRQLLANGIETDAYSGNLAKRHHATLLAEYLQEAGVYLCPSCAKRDGRRAAAEASTERVRLTMDGILKCGSCDVEGLLVTAKRATDDDEVRQRLAKHSLVEFSFGLAVPDQQTMSMQLFTRGGDRSGDGQMIMKVPSRSGAYGFCIRYKCVGIGMDTEIWKLLIQDESERRRRHQAVLRALRDQLLSPCGALTSTMLPHLSRVTGVITLRTAPGRAPMYSPLEEDFMEQLTSLSIENYFALPFSSISEFSRQMQTLIDNSVPYQPKRVERP